MEDRGKQLLNLVAKGLTQHNHIEIERFLGDRSTYIGMSDIGSYLSCPRAAVLKRMDGSGQYQDFSRLLALSRGHWFEDGVAHAFNALKLPNIRQLEISSRYKGLDFKVHLDFVLATTHPRPTVRILETKSCRKLPEVLYASYEMQVYGQLGLLAQHWNDPCFNYTTTQGVYRPKAVTFPTLIYDLLGIQLPEDVQQVDLEAWILCLSMMNAKVFGPYIPSKDMLKCGLDAGVALWRDTEAVSKRRLRTSELKLPKSYHPLCLTCDYAGDCPKFSGPDHPELEDRLEQLLTWKAERTALDGNIKQAEKEMKEAYARFDASGQWVSVGNRKFKVSEIPGRRSLDREGLANEIQAICNRYGLEIDIPDLFARHEKVGLPSSKLTVNTFKE